MSCVPLTWLLTTIHVCYSIPYRHGSGPSQQYLYLSRKSKSQKSQNRDVTWCTFVRLLRESSVCHTVRHVDLCSQIDPHFLEIEWGGGAEKNCCQMSHHWTENRCTICGKSYNFESSLLLACFTPLKLKSASARSGWWGGLVLIGDLLYSVGVTKPIHCFQWSHIISFFFCL